MQSTAMLNPPVLSFMLSPATMPGRLLFLGLYDLSAVVKATVLADPVGQPGFAALRAVAGGFLFEGIVRPALIPPCGGVSSLWDWHLSFSFLCGPRRVAFSAMKSGHASGPSR
jgi:hypothetical protein